jgi:hypothetical protein
MEILLWFIFFILVGGLIYKLSSKNKKHSSGGKFTLSGITDKVNFSSALEGIVVLIFILFIFPAMFPGPTKWFMAQENSFLILIFFLSCILGIIYLPEDKKEKKKKDDHHEDGH